MPPTLTKPPFSKLTLAAFGLPVLYWIYLYFNCGTDIRWDSLDYQFLGNMLKNQGWEEFFRTGPNREPLYPLFVSIAMRLADTVQVPYLKILAVFQFALLFLTQVLTYKLLQKLNLKPFWAALVIFYFGFSPTLINCALMLFSEILILPMIPASLLLIHDYFNDQTAYTAKQTLLKGLLLGTLMTVMTLTKGVFELVWPATLISALLIIVFFGQKKATRQRDLGIGGSALLIFFALTSGYKSLNDHYNHTFTIANRGASTLYASVTRRTEAMTQEKFLTFLATIPGDGLCKSLYGEEKCYFWNTMTTDDITTNIYNELSRKGLSVQDSEKQMLKLAIEKVIARPFQFSFFLGLENIKIFFWESTKLGFVTYPPWLERIYDWSLFKNALRMVMAILSCLAFVSCGLTLRESRSPLLIFIVLLVIFYSGAYSLFFINTRYAAPLAPLFLCFIALFAQKYYKW